jgi:hypothetical protein
MKDIVIKGKVIRRELILLGMMLLVALLMNVYAILVHHGQWSELLSQLHVVGLLTLFLYVLVLLFRLVYWGGRAVWRRSVS